MDIESGQDQQNIILRDIERTRYDIGKVREDMDKLTKKLQSMATDIVSACPHDVWCAALTACITDPLFLPFRRVQNLELVRIFRT
jgi:hypothetical protein